MKLTWKCGVADTWSVTVIEDHTCKMTIRTTGKGSGNTDLWSWERFWEVGVALVGMCVREGKEGVQTGLGECSYLLTYPRRGRM